MTKCRQTSVLYLILGIGWTALSKWLHARTACSVGSDRGYNIWDSTGVSMYVGVKMNMNNELSSGT